MADKKPLLNSYGDTLLETTRTHGADIAAQRIDELDLEALRFAIKGELQTPIALDLGCGLGVQGMRFALLGIETHRYDILDISARISAFKALFAFVKLEFHESDLRENRRLWFPEKIGFGYAQRFIHYLRYDEARRLLELVFDSMVSGGRLFLSASGLNSELGDGYAARDQRLETRYARLESTIAETHQIHEDVCLYTEGDLDQRATACGFVKLNICSHPSAM